MELHGAFYTLDRTHTLHEHFCTYFVFRDLVFKKMEFVYTPVHDSWLNMEEIELSVLGRQCLKRRIPDIETLGWEAEAWCEGRNRLGTSVEWRFTTADARMKLRKLSPSIDD